MTHEPCFNSQRDGILRGLVQPARYFAKVSIPNGMEFYQWLPQIMRGRSRFNSQRDGILRAHHICHCLKMEFVSIPNGMEFYPLWVYCSSISRVFQFPTGWNSTQTNEILGRCNEFCFNSQRDGILRERMIWICLTKKRFNSQRDGILQEINEQASDIRYRFNSQRDGILP